MPTSPCLTRRSSKTPNPIKASPSEQVDWVPAWGKDRMANMIRERADWCISRQRTWGVPLPIYYCKDCGKEYITKESIEKLKEIFKEKRVVIYNSQTKGWRLAKEYKSMSKIQREEEINQIKHTLEDKKSRIKALKKQMRKDIAYLKKVEQIELEEENYNHIPRID